MNNRIRREIKNARKHYLRPVDASQLETDTVEQFCDILSEFGLRVYVDPAPWKILNDVRYFVSNRDLTVGWYIKWYEHNMPGKDWAGAKKTWGKTPADELLEIVQ